MSRCKNCQPGKSCERCRTYRRNYRKLQVKTHPKEWKKRKRDAILKWRKANPERYREYMRNYMRERHHRLKNGG
jgi:hypothetical protein